MSILVTTCLLCGCRSNDSTLDNVLMMRKHILAATECSFQAEITADYGDSLHTFMLACESNDRGDVTFTVIAPDSISGISGEICETGGNLKFDNEMLAFPLLADGQLSPVSAPWILMHTLRSGYITASGEDEAYMRATINDSYAENALQLEVWFDDKFTPVYAEIIWGGHRILSLVVSNFVFA